MMKRGELMPLEGGGQIAYDEYGDPNGTPVIFCHGWPSSRTMAQITDAAARKLGVRIISPDRPGIRDSSFANERKLLDWPQIVRSLQAHLSFGEFRVLGVSGGAPYAYATAWRLRDEVRAVAIVSGAPQISELRDHSGLLTVYRWMLAVYARQPALVRKMFHVARPIASLRPPMRFRPLLLKLLQPCDAEVLRETKAFEACFESARRAWSGSARGVMTDAEIYVQPWGFPLEELKTPVRMWHGTKDRTFSFQLAQEMAERLGNCRLQLMENAGHYSLPIRHMEEILADLVAVEPDAPSARVSQDPRDDRASRSMP